MEKIRAALHTELFNRRAKNPAYSLRAFARNLGIPISSLSSIMNGRPPSKKNLVKIATTLGFKDIAEINNVKFKTPKHDWFDIKTDVFMAISQWHHFAILELIKVYHGRITPEFVAKKISIELFEARAALERLIRLELAEVDANGRYLNKNTGYASYFNGLDTTDAHKILMANLLDKSKEKLYSIPLEKRDHSSVTMSLSKKQLVKAKKMLKDFRRFFTEEMEKTNSPDAVYELTLSFYPLTTESKKSKETK
jgi:uncharacterized protein (TIGR02147 family)